MSPQASRQALAATLLEPGVESLEALETWQRHHEVAPSVADETLDFTLVIALARPAKAVLKKIMGLQLAEHLGALACAVAQDPGHRQGGVVCPSSK
jgi:hypothetical protein